jgi:hypothetical protein
VTSV